MRPQRQNVSKFLSKFARVGVNRQTLARFIIPKVGKKAGNKDRLNSRAAIKDRLRNTFARLQAKKNLSEDERKLLEEVMPILDEDDEDDEKEKMRRTRRKRLRLQNAVQLLRCQKAMQFLRFQKQMQLLRRSLAVRRKMLRYSRE